MTRSFHELDAVVLVRDVPAEGLRAGDLGTIVHVYAPDAFEVEFGSASGVEQTVVTLDGSDLRPVQDNDRITVRRATLDQGRGSR